MIGTEVYTSKTNPLHLQHDGTYTMTYPSGADTVLSLQPDGTRSTRPRGTAGPWECARRVAGGLLYEAFKDGGDVAPGCALFIPYFDV